MWKKVAVAAGVGAAVLGGGTIALAAANDSTTNGSGTPAVATSSPTSSPSPSAGSNGSAKAHHRRGAGEAVGKRFEHGEWVTKGTSGTETHDAIRGTASAVSASSITVKADDGYTLTFTVDSNTKVVLRENGKGSAKKGAIADVKTGQHVLVAGTKSGSTISARHVLDTGTQ